MNKANAMAESRTDEKDLILLVDDDPLIVESLSFMLRWLTSVCRQKHIRRKKVLL